MVFQAWITIRPDRRTCFRTYANVRHSRDERKQDIRWQSSGNNDDITALQYHPSNSTLLLSGADDGLVSVFDTSVADEDDSLVQAFDHGGSVHKAGFMSDAIYALSSDQKLIIKPLNSSASNDTEDIQPVDFGDLRPIAQCDYLIDVLPNVNQAYVVAGSNLRYAIGSLLSSAALC